MVIKKNFKKFVDYFFSKCYNNIERVFQLSTTLQKGGTKLVYSAVELSKYIVTKCVRDGHPISNLQLQKILFYIQKEYLSRNSQAFFEEIEAWQFGPVVPDAYYRFCGFGAMPITLTYDNIAIDVVDKCIIDPIVEEKRILNPWDLVDDTHKPNGAWSQIFQNGQGNHNVIPISLIKAVG